MSYTSAQISTSQGISGNGHNHRPNTTTATPRVDFNIFSVREIRDILKSKAHCLQAGFPPHHIIIKTLNDIRDHYISRVGLPTYLSQMLGECGQVPIQYCTLYGEDNRRLDIHLNNPDQAVQRFIRKYFQWDKLPFKVEIRKEGHGNRIEVRYL